MGEESDRLVLNVGGVIFETYISTLQNIPDTRLAWLTEGIDPDSGMRKEFFFDRHSGVFVHILNYYRTGKLHTPTDVCGPLFEEELNFWGIDEKQMEPCCWESFTKHREAELNLKNFAGPGFEDLRSMKQRNFTSFASHGEFTCRERMDRIWQIMDQPHSCTFSKYISIMSCLMILISVTVYCLDTMPRLNVQKPWRRARYGIDMFCMCWFTIEFLIRVLVCPDKKAFIQSIMNWIDFLSVIPSFLILFIRYDEWLTNLVIIRLLRLFRFFKLSYGLQVLLHTLKASSYELVLLLLILLIPVVIFSSLVHAVETHIGDKNMTKFISIPHTFWWCLITMTSVGYGDMVPETWAGKVVGGFCAICGVLIVALPISVIGSNFSLYYAHVRARLKLPCKDRKILAGNLRGLLKQPLSLSSRERDRRSLKRNNLVSIRRKDPPKRGGERIAHVALNVEQSISSNEAINKADIKELDSSEVCLDWDSTMDSEIQFNSDKSVKANSNKSQPTRKSGSRRQAVVSLFEESDSEAESPSSHSGSLIPIIWEKEGEQVRVNKTEEKQHNNDNDDDDHRGSPQHNHSLDIETDMSFAKETDSRKSSFFDHLASACSSRRASTKPESSSQNTPSSRRSSMKLIELSLMPVGESPTASQIIVGESPKREMKKNKKKKANMKKKIPREKSPTKNAEQCHNRARRGGILIGDYDEDAVNGFSSDSSNEERFSAVQSSQDSLRSPLIGLSDRNDNDGDVNHCVSDLSVELIPRLQRLKRENQWKEPLKLKPLLLNSRKLAVHKPLCHYFSLDQDRVPDSPRIILQQKLLRKASRSEFDIRVQEKCSDLLLETDFWCEKDPILREVSSEIDLGYIESGV